MTHQLTRQTPCAPPTPSRRTWRIRQSGVYPQPILSPWHARSVAVAAAALLHAAVMLAAGAVVLSCCHGVRATGYGLARPSISESVDLWRTDRLLTQTLYRNGCILRAQFGVVGATSRQDTACGAPKARARDRPARVRIPRALVEMCACLSRVVPAAAASTPRSCSRWASVSR